MNIKQFQDIQKLDSSLPEIEWGAKAVRILGKDPENLREYEIKSIIDKELKLNKIDVPEYIKLNNKTYLVERELTNLTFSQWIAYEQIVNNNEELIPVLHKILSIFITERKFNFRKFKYEAPYNEKEADIIAEELLNLDFSIAQSINIFFYLKGTLSMRNMGISFLEARQNEVNRMLTQNK